VTRTRYSDAARSHVDGSLRQRLICDSACAEQVDVTAVTSLLMAKRPCDEAGVATYEVAALRHAEETTAGMVGEAVISGEDV